MILEATIITIENKIIDIKNGHFLVAIQLPISRRYLH